MLMILAENCVSSGGSFKKSCEFELAFVVRSGARLRKWRSNDAESVALASGLW